MDKKNVQNMAGNDQQQKQQRGLLRNAKTRIFSLMMLCMSLMSLSAFAAEGETTTTSTTIASLVAEAGTTVPSMMSLAWDVITSNPLTSLSVIIMVAGIAFSLIRRARHAVR